MSDAPGFDAGVYRGALLTREVGRDLRHARAVVSTNDTALAAAAAGADHGLVVLAEEQTGGRGRNGAAWVAPPGKALLFSVLLRPGFPASEVPRLTFAAAVAIARTLEEGGLSGVTLKWPNDVLLDGDKVAGILCESRSRGERLDAVVVGIGLNVNQDRAELPPGATSLRIKLAAETDRAMLLAELLNRLEAEYARTVSGRFDLVLAAWAALSPSHRGHRVRIESPDQSFAGASDGVDPDGALRVVRDGDRATVRVVSGTARFG